QTKQIPRESECSRPGRVFGIARYNRAMLKVQNLTWLHRRGVRWMGAVFLLCALALASKEFVKPAAHPAKTYPAHDEHTNEAVAVAVDPYDLADKAQIFSVHWIQEGYLPIFLVITNDGDQPISLTSMKAEFVTVRRDKIGAATNDDLYRRLAHVTSAGPSYPI